MKDPAQTSLPSSAPIEPGEVPLRPLALAGGQRIFGAGSGERRRTCSPRAPVRPRIYVPSDFPDADSLMPNFELVPDATEVEGLIALRNTSIDRSSFDRAGPSLRVVANFGVGCDNIDLEEARTRGVIVTNTPDVSTQDVAHFALGLILDAMRGTARADRILRSRASGCFRPGALLGRSIAGARVGIFGAGRIGREVTRLLRMLGAEVTVAGRGELPLLLGQVDVLSLHCPLTKETRHLIDADALKALGPNCYLVNTARGPIVDEAALIWALQEGLIAGAALDVFEDEPEISPQLLSLENVILTPHLGAATAEARAAKADLVRAALEAVLIASKPPANRVC